MPGSNQFERGKGKNRQNNYPWVVVTGEFQA